MRKCSSVPGCADSRSAGWCRSDRVRGGKGARPAPYASVDDGRQVPRSVGQRRFLLQKHTGAVIRQMKPGACEANSDRVGGFEIEEPDAGLARPEADVRAEVGFVEA